MAAVSSIRKVLWAVDAFEEAGPTRARAIEAARLLSDLTGARLHPVYVLTPGQLNLSVEFGSPLIFQYRPAADRALEQFCHASGLENLEAPKVLVQNSMSTAHAVDLLARHAEQIGADVILANSHGRSGFSRFLLGSFSESLLMRSRVPVLTLGPESQPSPSFERILFPTEFDVGARLAFREAVALAAAFKTRITLLHAIPHPIEPIFQSGMYLLGGSWIPVQSYFNGAVERQRRRAEAWARWARGIGVEVDVRIETDDRPISEQIFRMARDMDAGLIFMEGRTGPIAAALIGSVTREVIRHAPCPVWVMRARGARASLRRAA